MATFQLKDGFGLNETITPGQSALSKYFQNLPDFSVATIDLAQLANQDLTNPAVTSIQGGVTFSQPIKIGKLNVELTVGASASAALSIFVPASDGAPLFSPDTFGDNIKVSASQRYVSLALSAQLNGSASASPGDLKFGFDGKSSVAFTYYKRFTAGTKVLSAVEDTIETFCIPGDLDDISAMSEGSIATTESAGDLKFSGSANLLALTNPLATVDVPLAGAVNVTGGVAITVGADYEFSGDYQLRIQKLAGKTFRFGVYRKRDSQFDFTVTANASLTAKLGDSDLFVKLMQAISSDPAADLKQLEAAGLSEDQSKAIQTAIKNAVNRSLEIGISFELSRSSESDAMFLYEVNLDAVQPDGRSALHSALEGDLSGLVKADANPPAGVTLLKSIVSTARTRQYSLKLNLLGIYNVLLVSKLLIQGTTAWDATTGELVLTDQATEDKIEVITSNLQVKDSEKLRQILAEHFLITATYRSVANVVGGPDVTGLQSYFHLEQNPSKVRMRDYLFLSVALGLQTPPAALSRLPKIDDFGVTTIYAEAGYDGPACRSLFFDGTMLHNAKFYTDAGREAIKSLVQPGDDDSYRLALATNDALFDQLQDIGNVQSAEFAAACTNAGIPHDIVPFVGVDYINVTWLRDAMVSAGTHLQAIDKYLQSNPNTDPTIS